MALNVGGKHPRNCAVHGRISFPEQHRREFLGIYGPVHGWRVGFGQTHLGRGVAPPGWLREPPHFLWGGSLGQRVGPHHEPGSHSWEPGPSSRQKEPGEPLCFASPSSTTGTPGPLFLCPLGSPSPPPHPHLRIEVLSPVPTAEKPFSLGVPVVVV